MNGFSRINELEPEDYYRSEEGFIVFTETYHRKRGYCCQSGCKHCPWDYLGRKKRKQKNADNT